MSRYAAAAVALAVLAALCLWVMRLDQAPTQQPAGAAAGVTLAALPCDAVTGIDVQADGYSVSLRRNPGGPWQLAGVPVPSGRAVDAGKLDALAWGLCPVTARRVAAGGHLSQYGLDRPGLRIAISGPGAAPVRLAVGTRNGITGGYYLRKEGDPGVYLWDSGLPDDLPAAAAGFLTVPTGGP